MQIEQDLLQEAITGRLRANFSDLTALSKELPQQVQKAVRQAIKQSNSKTMMFPLERFD